MLISDCDVIMLMDKIFKWITILLVTICLAMAALEIYFLFTRHRFADGSSRIKIVQLKQIDPVQEFFL